MSKAPPLGPELAGLAEASLIPTGSAKVPMKVVAATVAGNALEFYDFITYAFFAVYIGRTFFPAESAFLSLLLSVAVFGVGFVFRPLGGILIGAYADRAGRKPAMLLTIVLITIGTAGLALTPSYAQIGIAAPIIVVICRLIQGLALGGEVGPASAFLIEIAPPGQRGLYSSWQLASQGIASFAAGLAGVIMATLLSPEDLASWGWRVPFVLCLLLIPVAVYLRREMPETLHHGDVPQAERGALRPHSWIITLAILLVLGGTVSTYVGQYMTTYAIATLKLSPSIALMAAVVNGLTIIVGALFGGWLADRYGRRPVMLIPRIIVPILILPLFYLVTTQPSAGTLFAVTAFLSAMTAISGAASLVVIPELLPRNVRALGISIAYAIGVSLFGGTTQLIVTYMIEKTGNPTFPAWYVMGTSIITVIAMLLLPETKDRELDG